MESAGPHIVMVAGPNGAGKSTAARSLLKETLRVQEFVNADVIARGISGFRPDAAGLQAGRVMMARLKILAARSVDFTFEATLASRTFAPWIRDLLSQGCAFSLVFLWVPSVEVALARVRESARAGGHAVPEETVRRRYEAGLKNFFQIYRPLAARWHFYDNGGRSGPRLIARGRRQTETDVRDPRLWQAIKVQYEHGP
jgi:predicted ABC-type ATPase